MRQFRKVLAALPLILGAPNSTTFAAGSAVGSQDGEAVVGPVALSSLIVAAASASDRSLSAVEVKRLLAGADVGEDPNNHGYFYLKYLPWRNSRSRDVPFNIWYIRDTGFLGIALLKRPLRASRKAAEVYLMRKLKLRPAELCSLNYQLSVPNYVDSTHAGEALKFSFCPGAVRL